jgi:stage V sporulation protein B
MPTLIKERHNKKRFNDILRDEIDISYFVFVPLTIGVCVYAEEILMILFANNGIFLGSRLLIYLIMSIFFLIPLSILNCAMEAVGEEKVTMISMFVGGILKVVVGYILIGNQNFGILGAPISTLVFYITAFITSVIYAYKRKKINIPFITPLALPLANSFISIYAVYAIYLYISTKINWVISFILAVIMTIIVYFVLNVLEGDLKKKIQIRNRIS